MDVDLAYPTLKMTVRFLEMLWSLVLAKAHNVNRQVHKNRFTKVLKSDDFKWRVAQVLLKDPIIAKQLWNP